MFLCVYSFSLGVACGDVFEVVPGASMLATSEVHLARACNVSVDVTVAGHLFVIPFSLSLTRIHTSREYFLKATRIINNLYILIKFLVIVNCLA